MPDPTESVSRLLGAPLGVAWAAGLLWLILFAWRRQIGWAPLVASLVAVHAWSLGTHEVVAPSPGLWVAPGWLVLTAWPMIALVAHVRDGTHRARQLTIAVMVGIGVFTAVGAALTPDSLALAIRGLARGLAVFLTALTALVTWEILARLTLPVALSVLGALLLALATDAVGHGVFEALLRQQPFEGYVLGALVMAVAACAMHGAFGLLWLLVIEGARWTSPHSERSVLQVLGVMLGLERYDPMRPRLVRDASSGLYHRSFLEDRAPIELERAAHLAAPLSVLLIEARDEPERVGRALLGALRVTDLPARWADERYVAILPGAERDAARAKALRAVRAFRGEAAVGIARFPHDGGALEELVERARRHLHPVEREGAP